MTYLLSEAGFYARLAVGFSQAIRTPLLGDPEAHIRSQMEHRDGKFLDLVRRTIFADASNPYREMFRLAGCEYEDLEGSVTRTGLEPTLAALHRNGVYLSHDEFKGKQPIVRAGRHIPSNNRSFLNRLSGGMVQVRSSGSRSAGTRSRRSLDAVRYKLAFLATLLEEEFHTLGRPRICLNAILPSISGLGQCILGPRAGEQVERWFAQGGPLRASWHYRAVTGLLVLEAKLMGMKVPFPDYLPANDFSPAARWLAGRRAEGKPCTVHAVVSPAVRVAAAALDQGLDIRGTLFLVGGEALTDTKRAIVEAAGAEIYPAYGISEIGPVGHACRKMTRNNRVHILRDLVAVISYNKVAKLAATEVSSLLFTTLAPFSSHVFVNVEMDDAGVLEPADCDCTFTRFGYTQQIRDVYSYGKLTGQGITLVGDEMLPILEEILPARFGGTPVDYQLVERECGPNTQLTLRVNPRVRVSSAEEVERCFLGEVRKLYGGALSYRVWSHTHGFEVVLAEPYTTISGKVLPLHLLRDGRGPGSSTVGV